MDTEAFLSQKAEEIRAFAAANPELAHELRRMAEECEELAAQLRQDRWRGARA